MSLFQRGIRPPAIWSDEAVERYLAAIREEIALDPLFRRRLRGSVVNRFVAERESALRAGRRAGTRRMGALGRSVLYASFALAVSVTGTMAASQGAIPGEALYPLKRQIETLRIQALPARFHDELAAHALGERIEELGRLAEQGDWARVATHAAALSQDSDRLLELIELDPGSADRHLVVLNGLLGRLPERAQLAIADVVDEVESAVAEVRPGSRGVSGGGSSNGQGGGSSSGQNGPGESGSPGESSEPRVTGPRSTASAEPTPRPTPRAEPRATAEPDATPKPQPAPQGSKKPKPSQTATGAPSEDASD